MIDANKRRKINKCKYLLYNNVYSEGTKFDFTKKFASDIYRNSHKSHRVEF